MQDTDMLELLLWTFTVIALLLWFFWPDIIEWDQRRLRREMQQRYGHLE